MLAFVNISYLFKYLTISCVFGVMKNAMISGRVLISSFLEDLIRNRDTQKRFLPLILGVKQINTAGI